MHAPSPWPELDALLGGRWQVQALGASAFCDTWAARKGTERLFLKSTPAASAPLLRSEADGLRGLATTQTIRVPSVHALLERPGGGVILALEWLPFVQVDTGFGARFGAALAALHAHDCPLVPPAFGWCTDNHLGATPQRNTPRHEASRAGWIAFLADARFGALRERLRGASAELRAAIEAVIEALPALLADAPEPRPALIHGDLWSGNWGMLADGTPVVFDPAVSCSDPEAELAMMELFGSAPAGFRDAYEASGGRWPEPQRLRLYQLYHLLNHAVLFGGSYVDQALRTARSLL
jgi:protein-ribulosamine 3-kinase